MTMPRAGSRAVLAVPTRLSSLCEAWGGHSHASTHGFPEFAVHAYGACLLHVLQGHSGRAKVRLGDRNCSSAVWFGFVSYCVLEKPAGRVLGQFLSIYRNWV